MFQPPFRMLSMSQTTEVFSVPPVSKTTIVAKASQSKKKSRTPNPYFLFCKARRTELTALQPDMPSRDLTKILAEEWRNMSPEQRLVYSEEYKDIRSKIASPDNSAASDASTGLPIWIEIPTPLGEMITVAGYYHKHTE